MKKFFNILNRKLTVGNVLTIIASFIFAVIVRYLYLHLFDFLPVKGELEALDISYFAIVVLFKFIFSAFLEYLLNDKFSIPLFEAIGKGVEPLGVTMKMVDSNAQGSPVESSSEGKNIITKQDRDRVQKMIDKQKNTKSGKEHDKYIEELDKIGDKMWDVLMEQSDKILKLNSIKREKNVKFYEENGSLEITVPIRMTDSETEKITKEIGAIDR